MFWLHLTLYWAQWGHKRLAAEVTQRVVPPPVGPLAQRGGDWMDGRRKTERRRQRLGSGELRKGHRRTQIKLADSEKQIHG